MKKSSQSIRCEIESCAHCAPDHFCKLQSIKVSPCGACGCDDVEDKRDSMCASFENRIF